MGRGGAFDPQKPMIAVLGRGRDLLLSDRSDIRERGGSQLGINFLTMIMLDNSMVPAILGSEESQNRACSVADHAV